MNKNNIAYKLIISFTSATAVVLIFIALILSNCISNEYESGRFKLIKKQVSLIEKSTVAYLNQNSKTSYEDLKSVINMVNDTIDMDVFIVDSLGYIYLVSDEAYADKKYTKIEIREDRLNKIKNGESVSLSIANDGIKYDVYIEPIFNNEYFSGSIILAGESSSHLSKERTYILIWSLIGLAIILSSLISYYFAKKILIKPLKEINDAARKLSKGEVEKRISIHSNDEIGELAESFNIMAESLEESDKTRRDFISNVSHELRSPITSIKGFITGILDGVIPKDKENYYLNIVNDEIGRLARLVNDLLDISAMESGKFNLNMINIDVNEVITLCILNLEGKINAKKMNVEVIFHDDHEYGVADRDRLIQVVTNIIENAIKYGYENGEIKIDTYSKGDKIYVSIFNTGPIIAREDINNIWDRFYKSDKSRTNKVSLGLGLPIVRLILSQHGQDIWVNNVEDEGVKFTFTVKK